MQISVLKQGSFMKNQVRSTAALLGLVLSLVACEEADSQVGEGERSGGQADVPFSTRDWKTDFSKHSVPFDEILSGGPPKDGIPAIDQPKFVPVNAADDWIADREPIVTFEHDGVVRGYPWQILIWHEIVNDEVAGLPVSVTYCPLCNTAIAFDRRLGDRVLDFGTTGKLRHSDLVMYDRQTESWWQQATGEAIIGALTGEVLTFLPAPTMSWADFKNQYPSAQVLSRDTGHRRSYGANPYSGYDTGQPFLYRGSVDPRLPTMARVVVVQADEAAVVYPMERLREEKVINHRVGDMPVVLFHRAGTASAVDARDIGDGRDVGSAAVYSRNVDGQELSFHVDGDGFRDSETGTRWTTFGEAVEGPLAGKRLSELVAYVPFWFAWAAFAPDTPVYGL
jgi:hypothetical protein